MCPRSLTFDHPSALSVSNLTFTRTSCCKIPWSYQQWVIVQGRYKSPARALTSRHTQGQAVSGDPVMRSRAMSVAGFITVSWCLYSLAHAEIGISLGGVWTVSDDDRGEMMTFCQESKVTAVWELAHENYDWRLLTVRSIQEHIYIWHSYLGNIWKRGKEYLKKKKEIN